MARIEKRFAPDWSLAHAHRMHERLIRREYERGGGVNARYLPYIDPHHPLLQKMLNEIPGNVCHAIRVGSMAAAAVGQIDGDRDQTRVIGYYHDCGKMRQPQLYPETHVGERLEAQPVTSRDDLKTILNHPRASWEILSEYSFPKEICAAVLQHHGTTKTRLKGLELIVSTQQLLGTESLHYPGPRPNCRETAAVILADCVDSFLTVSRLTKEWPAKPGILSIGREIKRIGWELREAEQFAEANLGQAEQGKLEEGIAWWLFRFYNGLNVEGSPSRSSVFLLKIMAKLSGLIP